MFRHCLHVPTRFNDHSPVPTGYFEALESRLAATFGAFTRSLADGVWQDSGSTYSDPQYIYAIDSADDATLPNLLAIAGNVRDSLEQECVYVTHAAITTYLV